MPSKHLRAAANGMRKVLIVVARGAAVEEAGARLVLACHEQTNPVWPLQDRCVQTCALSATSRTSRVTGMADSYTYLQPMQCGTEPCPQHA